MKQLNQICTDINEIIGTDTRQLKKLQVTKLRNRLGFLNLCKNYLESGATEDFVFKERDKLKNRIKLIEDGFFVWLEYNKHRGDTYKEQRDVYENENDLAKLKTQLKTLDFILS